MTVTANSQGVVNTTFKIPAGVPAGSKQVEVIGKGGSRGEATFVGKGEIVQQELRQVTTQRVARGNTDPLAQTFTLGAPRLIGGVDIYMVNIGSSSAAKRVIVQIRGVTVGFPNSEVLAEGIVEYADLKASPNATRATFSPVMLEANTPYAIVVLTDDDTHSIAVAELGKFDQSKGSWVASQPYQIGVLLSSSNAQTWTPHQNMDMKFSLLAAKFDPTPKTVSLGTTTAANATDLVVLAGVDRPVADCDCVFKMTLDDGTVIDTPEEQAASLSNSYSGDVAVSAVLTGNEQFSPVLYGGVQAVKGGMKLTGDYVSRAIECDGDCDLTVTFERLAPSSSTVVVEYQLDSTGDWTTVPFVSGTQANDGFTEVTHKVTGLSPTGHLRVRLTLNGTAAARPRAKSLRAVVT